MDDLKHRVLADRNSMTDVQIHHKYLKQGYTFAQINRVLHPPKKKKPDYYATLILAGSLIVIIFLILAATEMLHNQFPA